MIRTADTIIYDPINDITYELKEGGAFGVFFVYANDKRISKQETTQAVWKYWLSFVHTDLTQSTQTPESEVSE